MDGEQFQNWAKKLFLWPSFGVGQIREGVADMEENEANAKMNPKVHG